MHYVNSRNVPVVTLESTPRGDPSTVSSHDATSSGAGRSLSSYDDLHPTVPGVVVQAVSTDVVPNSNYAPYLSSGSVRVCGEMYPVNILRDTGASVSLWVLSRTDMKVTL
ncbi:hypothetical protein Pcinc_007734 [Petrolisthes cinctipes]|uniref:Uncharacterized protein n=1 Tax=Petrolisthes cinctipes TaxID=88211 RepID=A0AAE1KXX3_PETCI|nr:hypothetical protein Pcinc_007734 [Petrolisthes cinctipes]